MTALYLLIYRHFLVSAQSNFVLLLSSAKTVNKQGYIHASYQVLISLQLFSYFQWLEFSPCLKLQVIWRLTSKWLV